MRDEVKKLEENLKLDFPNTYLSFGRKITFDIAKAGAESAEGLVALRFDYQEVNSEMSRAFKTPTKSVKDLQGIIACAHKSDEKVIELLHSVLMTLGYVDEAGSPGIPPRAPFAYRDLTFHGIELPSPGLITSAFESQNGDFYEVVQRVNFAFHIT